MATIMQVVKTNINNKEINVMFDSGSDRSFITEDCAKSLQLDCVGRENVSVTCFADERKVTSDRFMN